MADVLGQRDPALPAAVPVRRDGNEATLMVDAMLRVLPGKRAVVRGRLDGAAVVAKCFLGIGAQRACTAERGGLDALARLGIATPRVIGEASFAGGRAILLEEVTGVPPQHIDAVIETVARMHAGGVVQRDLHLDNFIATEGGLVTLDGAAVDARAFPGPLPWRRARDNLALLAAQLGPLAAPDYPRILATYRRARGETPDAALEAGFVRRARRASDARVRRYLDKTLRRCSEFEVLDRGPLRCIVGRRHLGPSLERLLADPDGAIAHGRWLKRGNSATVALTEAGGQRYVVKRYNVKSVAHGMRRLFRSSRARQSWRWAHLLRLAGIPSLAPIALIERPHAIYPRPAYLISDEVEGVALDELARAGELSDAVIGACVKLFSDLAICRIEHGDTKASNFRVSGSLVRVIDLDGMRRHGGAGAARRGAAADVTRFLENWRDLPVVERRFRQAFAARVPV